MAFKRIVVLANSIKKHARCVAGREVGLARQLVTGDWIRPVSGESEGELEPHHMRIEGDARLNLLEIVDVPLGAHADDRIHPEDWIVDAKQPWKKVGKLDATTLGAFEEQPKNLWLESKAHSDRAARNFLLTQPDHQSLYLIRPTNLRIELSHAVNPYKNKNQKKTRAKFFYRGQAYEMSLTDPDFTDRYCTTFPELGAKPVVVRPPYTDRCLVCISLTPIFNGYHYKVVAAILRLP